MVCFLHFLWSVKNELWGDMKMFPSGPFSTFLCKWGRMGWIDLEPSNRASLFIMKKIAQILFPNWPLTMFVVPVDIYLQFCIFKIFYCSRIIKNYLLGISLTQSWKKSFFCSDTWQMFLVLNGMGIKDKRPNCPSVSHFIIQLYPVLFTQFRPSHKRAWGSPLVTCRWDTRPESLSMNNTDPLND